MSSYGGDEEEIAAARRKAAWQLKSARIKAKMDREYARLQTVDELKTMGHDDPAAKRWLDGQDKSNDDAAQMDYARQYQADYHDFVGLSKIFHRNQFSDESINNQQYNGQSSGSDHTDGQQDNSYQGDGSVSSATIGENSDTFEEKSTRLLDDAKRSRRGKLSSLFSGPKSMGARSVITNDMERVSTIMPLTEANVDADFTSNVDVESLKKTYFRNYKTNTTVPIYSQRTKLINSINTYSVVIIQGRTGCGKTTQVPAYILEDAILDRGISKAPVVWVTQPRRIAARSIAKRVADEHDWELGKLVGYQVGLEKMAGEHTILTFCTAGVLLQKLINEKSLSNYSHIVIDEAHERDADTDLLMMMIRTLMRKEKSFFRLIVMSATIHTTKLKDYFTFKTSFGHNAVTVPSICRIADSPTANYNNEVRIFYLENLADVFRLHDKIPQFDMEQPETMDECLTIAVKIIINIIPNLDTFRLGKTVLVFLPGLAEITKLHRRLQEEKAMLDIIPVHSSLPYADQNRMFIPSPHNHRKVILATNIAESSITVKDAGFIIDFCLTKTLKKDECTKFPMLKVEWCTLDKLTQRAGRTGRCCPGKVFRLITKSFHDVLPKFSQPELLISPLELSILKVKTFDMGEVKALLAVVLDPPPLQEIKVAVLELKQIGAMTATYNGKLSDEDGDLTELGRIIAKLPIDVHLSKLIVVASLLDVLDDAIIVAASLSSNRNVVRSVYDNAVENHLNKLEWARESQSDLFVSIDVYREYMYYKEELLKDAKFMETYCNNKNLDERKLEEIRALRQDLIFRLENQNIKILDQPNRERDRDEDELMLKVSFCAAFYPNYYLNQELDPDDVKRDLCGHDPTKTVVLHGFPVDQVPLYRTQILEELRNRNIKANIDYFADTSRALLTINEEPEFFGDESQQHQQFRVGGILQGQRNLFAMLKCSDNDQIRIREYTQEAAFQRMEYYRNCRASIEVPRLIPGVYKLVDGPPNNNHLTVLDDAEYNENLRSKYYAEVQFNHEQDEIDMNYLQCSRNFNHMFRDSGQSEIEPIFGETRYLRGPNSPIQMKFVSVLNKSKGYNVDICPNSVNSILLASDYEKPRRQMLVSASVSQSQRSSRIIVRDTTLMPDIIGLPTLMSLLFARNYRLIYNELLKCYSGAIFSLGWDKDGKPLRREYEVELDFDIHIIQDDLELINRARKNISSLIRYLDINNPGAPQAELQLELRKIIISLMKRRRHSLKTIDFPMIDWKEGIFTKDNHNQLDETIANDGDNGDENEMVNGSSDDIKASQSCRLFLPPLKTAHEVKELDLIIKLRENIDRMDRIERNLEKIPIGGIQCLLCGSGIGHIFIFRSKLIEHTFSDLHIKELERFEISEGQARARARAEILDHTQ